MSVTPQSYVGVAHSLTSFTARPDLSDDTNTIPPLPPMSQQDTTTANQNAEISSHDQSADHTSVEIEVEYNAGGVNDNDQSPLLASDGHNSLIV